MPKNYYDILGVNKSASKDEIKKAFHKLAHKYHPDKKGGDEAKFKEINEAYQTLADEKKRQQYDAFGSAGPGAGGFGGFDFSGFTGGGQGAEFDFGDIFSEFFGGGQGGGRVKRGRDISVAIEISFAESVFGTQRQILINKVGVCETCHGTGAKAGTKTKSCASCNGKGRLRETRQSFLGTFSTTRECPTCNGRGEVPETPCQTCGGAGVRDRAEEIKVVVPSGIDSGEMIRMSNQGEAMPGGVSGDLYIKIHIEKHKVFRRDGTNLIMDLPVRLTDALVGAEYEIETLDGKAKLNIPAGVSSGETLRLRDKGVVIKPGKRGDLVINVIVKTPAKLSKRAKELIDQLKQEGI
jgi:molecular chaperone DnaJ